MFNKAVNQDGKPARMEIHFYGKQGKNCILPPKPACFYDIMKAGGAAFEKPIPKWTGFFVH